MTKLTKELMRALQAEFDVEDVEDIEAEIGDTVDVITIEGQEYDILSDEEADDKAVEYIRDTVWAFNAGFLESYTGVDAMVFELLSEKCEDANEAIISIIEISGTIEDFTAEAISGVGRGHFLSGYDGEEHEVTDSTGETVYLYAN